MKHILHYLFSITISILMILDYFWITSKHYTLQINLLFLIYFPISYIYYYYIFKKHNATNHFMHLSHKCSKIIIPTFLITIFAFCIFLERCKFNHLQNMGYLIFKYTPFIYISINLILNSTLYNIITPKKYDTTIPSLSTKQKTLSKLTLLILSLLPIIFFFQYVVTLGDVMCISDTRPTVKNLYDQ